MNIRRKETCSKAVATETSQDLIKTCFKMPRTFVLGESKAAGAGKGHGGIPKRCLELLHSRALAAWQRRLFILSHFLKNRHFPSCLLLVFLHNHVSSLFFFSFLGA